MSNQRVVSIDFLRGATITLMIMVNNPGSWDHMFNQLSHSHWNGCTFADLIFPLFIFIMGASVAFSLNTKKRDSLNHNKLIAKILKRGMIIIFIGILKDNFPFFKFNFETDSYELLSPSVWRIPGVLQRIGLVYVVVGFLFVKLKIKYLIALSVLLLITYWGLLNVKLSYFEHDLSNGYSNLGAWLDRKLLSRNHLWKYTRQEGWDPESLFGTISASVTGFLGCFCGVIIKSPRSMLDKVKLQLGIGVLLTFIGGLWHSVSPINKSLWTGSYVLFTGGISFLLTAFCLWLIDEKKYDKFSKPFIIIGSNALSAYILSESVNVLLDSVIVGDMSIKGKLGDMFLSIFSNFSYAEIGPGHADITVAKVASHLYALVWIVPYFLLLSWMYRRKVFIKI